MQPRFQPQHSGLYFGPRQISEASARRGSPQDDAARQHLMDNQAPAWRIQRAGYLYRFEDAVEATSEDAEFVVNDPLLTSGETILDALVASITAIQNFEMLRDHPVLDGKGKIWLQRLPARLQQLDEARQQDLLSLEQHWYILLDIASGVALEDEARFRQGVARFQQVIDQEIHPEGYIKAVVTPRYGDPLYTDGQSLRAQLLSVAALVLAAEAAVQAGTDLWQYENRGVSVTTAAVYMQYYYFFPDKWRWEQDNTLTTEFTQTLYREHAAFMEIVAYRAHPRSIEFLLEEQRPMLSPSAGGLTTLSHGSVQIVKKRRGLFG